MSSPLLTVLMSVYNAEKYVAKAVDSILAQTFRDFDFVVVDDGSTDECPSILKGYADRDHRIAILSKPNSGLAAALNFGLRHVESAYVARMDADDIAHPDRLSRQLAFLEARPDIAAAGTRVVCIDEAGRTRHVRPVVTGPEAIANALPFRNCINHSSAMLRTAALAEARGYREKFRVSQDYDLWLRLIARHRLDNIDEVLLRYRTYAGTASSARNRSRLTAHSVCAVTDYFSRKYGLPTSDGPIDIAEPTQVTNALTALLSLDLLPSERKVLYRHSLRLIRFGGQGNEIRQFARFLRRHLAGRHAYGQLAKMAIYTRGSLTGGAQRPTGGD
jgi:glycosyltransferase involved in cell wall biosynthesis